MIVVNRRRLVGGMIATFVAAFCPVGEKCAKSGATPGGETSSKLASVPSSDKAKVNDYSTNPTVFGRILRGEIPSRGYIETEQLYAFQDIAPSAPLHALVIPKRFIPSVKSLLPSDADLVADMKSMGAEVIRREQPRAFEEGDYIFCFHIPPFNSVRHLHLHVLAPASDMSYFKRYGKYQVGTTWCTGVDEVEARLRRGERAVRSPLWGKT